MQPRGLSGLLVFELLGRGGMGSVYLAERSDSSFTQKVALKILRSGLNDTGMEARFKSERQILADLRHPNIARLIDGGTTDDGVPYLALEYVDGERIDRWCDAHRFDIERRIELFRAVCEALQAAHRSLVVHRDLKPANILVTPDGHPRLLDRGAKNLEVELVDEAMPVAVRVLGPDHPEIAYLEVMRGRQYRFLGRNAEAEASFLEAARIERLARGPDHPYVGYAEIQLGTMRAQNGRFEEAEASFREALRIYRKAYPEGDRNVANTLSKLAEVELQRGRPEAALALARESRALFGRLLPDDHTELLQGDILVALSLAEAGYEAEARPFLEALLPRIEAVGGKGHRSAIRVQQALDKLPAVG